VAAPNATSIAVLSAKGLSGTSYTTAAIGVADSGAGAYAVLLAGQGGTNVISSVTDSAGNTYTAIPGTNATSGGNAGTWIFLSGSNPNPLLTTTTFTVANSLSVGRYVLHVFKIDVAPVVVAGTGAFGSSTSSTAVAVTSGTPSVSGDYLWLAITGWQSTGQTLTISSTGYTLIPTGTAVEGTTGGSATTNISAKVGYKQVLGSAAAQNFNGTQSAFVTWGDSIAALAIPAAPVALHAPIVISQAAMRAASR
jgi:hypothetical protein